MAEKDGNYYGMTKNKRSSGHLLGSVVTVYDGNVVCDIGENTFAWRFKSDNTIQDVVFGKYLTYSDAQTKLDSKLTKWNVSDNEIVTADGSNRYLRYHGDRYFAAYLSSSFSSTNVPAYPADIVRGYVRTGLSVGKWGTICLPYDVIASDRSGAVYYNILGKTTENGKVVSLMLEEETGVLLAGQPYVFVATGETLCNLYLDIIEESDAATVGGARNGLVGSLVKTDVEQGMFVINGNKVLKCGSNCKINANRAYINMSEVPEMASQQPAAARHTVEMKISDGITTIESIDEDCDKEVYYNIHGQRVVSPTKGLYILDGKKVIVK